MLHIAKETEVCTTKLPAFFTFLDYFDHKNDNIHNRKDQNDKV